MKIASIALATISLAVGLSFPVAADASSFYQRGSEGWFWYQDPPAEEEPELIEPEEEEPQVVVMEIPEQQAEPQGPSPLSAEWFRENLQVYIDRAIDDPSPENIEAYFLLQRVMMDKAQTFAENSQRVILGDPLLDETNRRPNDPASAQLLERESNRNRQALLSEIMDSAGIAFFFSGENCILCAKQAETLTNLSNRTGLEVMPISLDGAPLSNGLYPDAFADTGQAEILGIEQGPAIYLMVPPNTWIGLAHSATTQEDLTSRILSGAVQAGVISQERLNATRPVNQTRSLHTAMDAFMESGQLPDDPAELIEILRNWE